METLPATRPSALLDSAALSLTSSLGPLWDREEGADRSDNGILSRVIIRGAEASGVCRTTTRAPATRPRVRTAQRPYYRRSAAYTGPPQPSASGLRHRESGHARRTGPPDPDVAARTPGRCCSCAAPWGSGPRPAGRHLGAGGPTTPASSSTATRCRSTARLPTGAPPRDGRPVRAWTPGSIRAPAHAATRSTSAVLGGPNERHHFAGEGHVGCCRFHAPPGAPISYRFRFDLLSHLPSGHPGPHILRAPEPHFSPACGGSSTPHPYSADLVRPPRMPGASSRSGGSRGARGGRIRRRSVRGEPQKRRSTGLAAHGRCVAAYGVPRGVFPAAVRLQLAGWRRRPRARSAPAGGDGASLRRGRWPVARLEHSGQRPRRAQCSTEATLTGPSRPRGPVEVRPHPASARHSQVRRFAGHPGRALTARARRRQESGPPGLDRAPAAAAPPSRSPRRHVPHTGCASPRGRLTTCSTRPSTRPSVPISERSPCGPPRSADAGAVRVGLRSGAA